MSCQEPPLCMHVLSAEVFCMRSFAGSQCQVSQARTQYATHDTRHTIRNTRFCTGRLWDRPSHPLMHHVVPPRCAAFPPTHCTPCSDAFSSLRVGPPLYVVVRGLNLSSSAPDVRRVCGISGCDADSLANRVAAAAAAPGALTHRSLSSCHLIP